MAEINVQRVNVKRMPNYVMQSSETVRVYWCQPGRVELQLRNKTWYATATLTREQTQEIVKKLQESLADLE
jgi:hypothetical protein